MPWAPAVGAVTGGAGMIGSGVSGKKAQKAANRLAQQQLGLQQEQFGLTKQQVGLGNAALGPSTNYWNALLRGGQAAVQATGPYASQIGQVGQGARTAIAATTPRGGEANLATAQSYNQTANDIARLYAGMQPLAAQGLAQNAGAYFGSGASLNPPANVGAAYGAYEGAANRAAQGAGGFGSLLYNALNKLGKSKGASTPAPSLGGKFAPLGAPA